MISSSLHRFRERWKQHKLVSAISVRAYALNLCQLLANLTPRVFITEAHTACYASHSDPPPKKYFVTSLHTETGILEVGSEIAGQAIFPPPAAVRRQ